MQVLQNFRKSARVCLATAMIIITGPLTAGSAYAAVNGNNGNPNPGNQITICHSTNSDSNPYDIESPNANGTVDGHASDTGPVWDPTLKNSHIKWGDIIPSFTYNDNGTGTTLTYPGLNWDAAGQAIWNNSCNVASTLTVAKHVAGGGPKVAADFSMTVTGTDVSQPSFKGNENGTKVTLTPGGFSAGEIVDASYTQSTSTGCSGTILAGQNLSCTITNTYNTPVIVNTTGTLTVVKQVVGSATLPGSFTIHVKQSGVDVSGSPMPGSSAGTPYTLFAGNYLVAEDSAPGFTTTYSGGCNASGVVVLVAGDSKTCTVTNTSFPIFIPMPGMLTVIKHVVNTGGGTKQASDFQVHVEQNGSDITGSPQAGSENGTPYSLMAGSYNVSEGDHTGYTEVLSGDCNSITGQVSVLPLSNATCTITNTFDPGRGNTGGTTGSGTPSGSGSQGSVVTATAAPVATPQVLELPATGSNANPTWFLSLLGATAMYWVSLRRQLSRQTR